MGTDPSLTPELIQAQGFTSGFRGYDQAEVRAFLARVATGVRALGERADQLESAWHSAEERAARPPVLDEDTLMAAVGEETASILRAARATAADLRNRATQDADRIIADADERSARIRAEAEGVLGRETHAAEEAAARIVETAKSLAAEMVDKARAEGDSVRAAAQQEKALTVEGAIATRERILEDLSRRRRVASVQIEQLRAGRERLLESYAVVRRTLEEVNDQLNRADTEARAAADEVGRRMQREHQAAGRISGRAELDTIAESAVVESAVVKGAVSAEVGAGSEPVVEDLVTPTGPDNGGGEATVSAPRPPATQAGGPSPTAEVAGAAPSPVAAPGPAPPPVPPASATEETGRGFRGRAKRRGRAAAASAGGSASAGAEVLAAPEEQRHEVADSAVEATVPHLRVLPDPHDGVAAAMPDEAGGATSAPGSQVDVLFARIRAGRGDDPEDASDPPQSPDEMGVAADPPADGESGEEQAEVGRSDGDEALLQQREAAVIDLEVALTRKLKRTLQDEQNDLLDRLRSLRGEPSVARLLPDLDEQVARYASAAQPLVDKAAAAGVAFAVAVLERKGRANASAPAVTDTAREAATTIVESLRRRLEHAISASAGDDQAVLVEGLGSAYREWKTERIERVAGDVLAAAFSRGTWSEVPEGTPLRWIVEDTDGPCPDCDDDALAGTLPKGEAFPTGQHYPPAHTGCRCLLVPATG